ncbi:MAG: hypothetical protein JNK58_04745 [Phycisphaerae bacterium]|nr:hypothetical protein [Phycisphaerae bacterium]
MTAASRISGAVGRLGGAFTAVALGTLAATKIAASIQRLNPERINDANIKASK